MANALHVLTQAVSTALQVPASATRASKDMQSMALLVGYAAATVSSVYHQGQAVVTQEDVKLAIHSQLVDILA